eukprot:scaffold110951_cov57-Phaeocystis_antarctica.AAC.2
MKRASEGVALTASLSQSAWAASVRMDLKKAGTASGLASRKACSWPGLCICSLHVKWATSMAQRPSASVSPASEGVALTASPSQAAWAASEHHRRVGEQKLMQLVWGAPEEGSLHRQLARWHSEVDGAAAVGVGEPGERGSGLDGLAEPGGVGGVGEDGLEEGGHRQRVGEQEGVQLAWGVLARLDDEEACVDRDEGLRRLSLFGAWGEGQLLAAAELPGLRRQHLQRAAHEVEPGEGLQLPELRRQHLQRAAAEAERGEGLQLPDLGRQHLQLATLEVEPLDAVIAPRDASPRAWALAIVFKIAVVIAHLAIGPPLLQRRARRPHRPQRVLVRLYGGATTLCLLHEVGGATAIDGRQVGELGSGLDGLAEPVGKGAVASDVTDDELEEGGCRQRVGEQEGVQLAWGVLARLDDEEACVGRDDGLRRLSLLDAWGERQLLAVGEEEVGEGLQLPELGRQLLQRAVAEVELLDAVIAPLDAFPRAWALATPPLLQRRARRPHRPQRGLVRIRHLEVYRYLKASNLNAFYSSVLFTVQAVATGCCKDSLVWRGDSDCKHAGSTSEARENNNTLK